MIHRTKYDVAIIGGGPAGLTLACLLGRRGISVACIDRAPANAGGGDLRTTAISYGSRKILEEAGIWQQVADKSCPIEKIDILDGDSPVLLNFLSGEMEGKTFGWIVLNSDLRAAMAEAGKNAAHIKGQVKDFAIDENSVRVVLSRCHPERSPAKQDEVEGSLLMKGDPSTARLRRSAQDDNIIIEAKLIVGADGRNSFVREWMDVPVREWNYKQRAVVCTVQHENPHENIAVEHFWPEGPFAILPIADDENGTHRSSVVFTEHGPEKKSLMRLSDADFEIALAEKFPERYGAVKLIGGRAAHNLSLVHAARYIAPRMALVADAAHGIHPVAGQGLNLGFRDVKALADLLGQAHENGEDPGSDELLQAYQRARRFDNMTMVAVTDGLVRLFSSRLPGTKLLRRAGLKAVAKLPVAKRFFMKQAMGDR